MEILKWDKEIPIFDGRLDAHYATCDACDVFYVVGTGFCVLNYAPKYSLYQRLKTPEIQDVFVVPEARGQGVATSLITHCESVCETEMIGISVPVSPDFGAAQRLYYKLGYQPDGNGVTYDREPCPHNSRVKLDDNLCLMMVKDLS